jgi:hypothetical protein
MFQQIAMDSRAPAQWCCAFMATDVRKGQGDVKLTRGEFERRLRERFSDPEFQKVERQIADILDVAWHAYDG